MPESPAYRDEDANKKWGDNGKTAKLLAVKWCSDNGFYNTSGPWDKGGWRFSAGCDNSVPGDWSRRFTDESAREINGGWNRNDAARQNCQQKGYLGIDTNQWNFGAFWDASLKCVNPGWIGDWSNRNGCQADGQMRWSRQVDARGMDWDLAADWLINNNEVKQHGFSKVWKERNNGMWIVALRDDKNCFIYNEGVHTNQCIGPGQINLSKKCNNWPNGWTATQDVVNGCKKNAPAGSTPRIFGAEVWAEWTSPNANCNPGWVRANWNDDGCQADGQKRFARQVDAKGMNWDQAADWLIVNDTKQHNFSTTNKENKGAGGMWVIGYRDDGNCFIYNEALNTNQCTSIGKRNVSKKCNNWPNGWMASGDVVKGCEKNKPNGTVINPAGSQWVGAEWIQDDSNCNPGWYGDWVNDGCKTDGRTRFARKVDAKGLDWDQAADWLLNNNEVKQHNFNEAWKENKGVGGMWIVGLRNDGNCNPTWSDITQKCDSQGSQMSWQKCTNWANNDVKSCLDAPNKPSKIIGWIPCAIGSDPTKTTCSPYSTDFNCKWGQECYGVTQYAKFPNNGSCDTTTFEDTKKICDSKAGSMTYKKCTNWFGNDPKSCINTLKPK